MKRRKERKRREVLGHAKEKEKKEATKETEK